MKIQLQIIFTLLHSLCSIYSETFLDGTDFANAGKLQAPKLKLDSEELPRDWTSKKFLYRNMIRNRNKIWPDGILPYVLSGAFNDQHRAEIARSILDFEGNTCIRYYCLLSISVSSHKRALTKE